MKNQDILHINFDDFAKEHWTDQEQKNVKLVIDFIQNLMNLHDFDYVEKTFGWHDYTQHNRSMTDGISGVFDAVKDVVKRFPEYTYDVKHVYADGEFVTFHSQATVKKKDRGNPDKGYNIFDTWKIKDEQISEHWDALQPIDFSMRFLTLLTGGKKANGNGLY